MMTDKSMKNMERQFSNLSAEDLENLQVEELEQRLELAAIDFTASVLQFNSNIDMPKCNGWMDMTCW